MEVVDLGRLGYRAAYAVQEAHHAEVLAAREAGGALLARVLLVEHDPVITVTRKAIAGGHVLAGREALAAMGVALEETDRGGDVTYHGPGQVVAYPIVDLNRCGLRLHAYMRLLEEAVIRVLDESGIAGQRDPGATGVWVPHADRPPEKIAAMGVRVRKWVSLHGLAVNVAPQMAHFDLIVPCGLHGRGVTSMAQELGPACPVTARVRSRMGEVVAGLVREAGRGARGG